MLFMRSTELDLNMMYPIQLIIVNMEQISKCTNKFQLLPKSPAKGDSNFADKIKPVFVLDTELLKATIRFEENQKKVRRPKSQKSRSKSVDGNSGGIRFCFLTK